MAIPDPTQSVYTFRNALNWGICNHHYKESNLKSLSGLRHGILTLLTFFPIVGQIFSLLEWAWVKITTPTGTAKKVDEVVRKRMETKGKTISQDKQSTVPTELSRINEQENSTRRQKETQASRETSTLTNKQLSAQSKIEIHLKPLQPNDEPKRKEELSKSLCSVGVSGFFMTSKNDQETLQKLFSCLADPHRDLETFNKYLKELSPLGINSRYHGPSLLECAARNKDFEAVKILVESGAKDATEDTSGEMHESTALYSAARIGDINIMEYLLRHGASPNTTTKLRGYSVSQLPNVIRDGSLERIKLLFAYSSNRYSLANSDYLGSSPLEKAIEHDCADIFEYLLQQGAKIPTKYSSKDPWGDLFFESIQSGRTKIVKFLLDSGVPLNYRFYTGHTGLHMASAFKKQEIVNLFLSRDVDEVVQKIRDKQNRNYIDYTKEVLNYAALCKISTICTYRFPSSEQAYYSLFNEYDGSEKGAFEECLKHVYDMNVPFDLATKETILHRAVESCNELYPIKKLIDKGADLLVPNAEGQTPLELAYKRLANDINNQKKYNSDRKKEIAERKLWLFELTQKLIKEYTDKVGKDADLPPVLSKIVAEYLMPRLDEVQEEEPPKDAKKE